MRSILLLDTSSLVYRAYFALPTSIKDRDGRPVNAAHGYLDMTTRLIEDRRPDEVWHVLDDDWRPAPRVAAYDGYKSARAEDPDDLPWQFVLLRDVLEAFGERVAWSPGWEADDAIGVLTAGAADDDRVDVVTGDRDLLQLVRDPVVRVLFTRRGVSEMDVFDEAKVLDAYGIPAARYVDFATLRGDPSDGLPGVRGVGEKTARKLIAGYPDLDALLADADAQTPRLASTLHQSREYLAAMRAVVPVRTDVEVRSVQPEEDPDKLTELAEAHRLGGPIGRLRSARGAALSSGGSSS